MPSSVKAVGQARPSEGRYELYGLCSAFVECFMYFFLGASRDVTVGPTSIMSLLVSYTFHESLSAVLLAFLWGCMQLAMGFLRLDRAGTNLRYCLLAVRVPVDFISCPVIKGFTSPATVTVGFGQIKSLKDAVLTWVPMNKMTGEMLVMVRLYNRWPQPPRSALWMRWSAASFSESRSSAVTPKPKSGGGGSLRGSPHLCGNRGMLCFRGLELSDVGSSSCLAIPFLLYPSVLSMIFSVQCSWAPLGVVGGIRVTSCSLTTQRVTLPTVDAELRDILEV
ncbi:hypothetical protein HPG69_019238 [Diceros bicornis minor]|uniref:SLC26A/SulP transporter domain-containing protein n=1 Tax=Diceros bicornis minor TaxID=77932 RepID=A0A7J7FML8_DICBM|nr:hypothetical protein HPG69_019238 [Diceros bicornis minor]